MRVEAWTPMIRTRDMRYPVYLSDFKLEFTNTSIGSFVYEENLVEFGYFPVLDTEVPTGDVVTEAAPVLESDGKWYKSWVSRDFTPEEVAENLKNSKESSYFFAKGLYRNDLISGVVVDGNTISCSSEDMGDILATLTAQAIDGVKYLKTADNRVITLPEETADSVLREVVDKKEELFRSYLRYVSEVNSATDQSSIPELPTTFKEE